MSIVIVVFALGWRSLEFVQLCIDGLRNGNDNNGNENDDDYESDE